MDVKVFAHIDKEMFKQTIIDTAKVAEKIKASEDFKTLLEVVQSQIDSGEQNNKEKQIYKVHNFNASSENSHRSNDMDASARQ